MKMSEQNKKSLTILTHKSMKLRRYNNNKRGSFEVNLWFYDHELSGIIGALRLAQKHHKERNHKAYVSHLKNMETKISKALSLVLKVELKDLKLNGEKELC